MQNLIFKVSSNLKFSIKLKTKKKTTERKLHLIINKYINFKLMNHINGLEKPETKPTCNQYNYKNLKINYKLCTQFSSVFIIYLRIIPSFLEVNGTV